MLAPAFPRFPYLQSPSWGVAGQPELGFFGWRERKGTILRSPYGLNRPPRLPWPPTLPEVLTPEETVQVLEAVKPTTGMALRARSILELLYSTAPAPPGAGEAEASPSSASSGGSFSS